MSLFRIAQEPNNIGVYKETDRTKTFLGFGVIYIARS